MGKTGKISFIFGLLGDEKIDPQHDKIGMEILNEMFYLIMERDKDYESNH